MRTNRGPVILVGLIIGMMGLLHLLATISLQEAQEPQEYKISAIFQVGECIESTLDREAWEPKPQIYRIMAIGKKSYKICAVGENCTNVLNGVLDAMSISFASNASFKVVSCGGL